MKWTGIVGTWRISDDSIEDDVRDTVSMAFQKGHGIISGGALGVDYIAVDEALQLDPSAQRITVFLPTSLKTYSNYFNKRVEDKIVDKTQVRLLMHQLRQLKEKNPEGLVEGEHQRVQKKSFHARNTKIVTASDEVIAFQKKQSTGTQNTINTARKIGKPVQVFAYN